MRNVASTTLLAVLMLAIVSCPNPGGGGTTPPDTTTPGAAALGSLVITLPQTNLQDAKTPNLSVPSSYDALGAGPANASFQKLGITGTSVTIGSLSPGNWGVTVNGNNLNGMQVASTSIQATVAAGQTASVNAIVTPSVGQGTFDASMSWPAGIAVLSPGATLAPLVGSPISITLAGTVSGITFSAHVTTPVAAGYYVLSASFLDSKNFTWGGAEAVYIASGKTTSLVFSPFDAVKMTINPDISKAIPINFTSLKPKFGRGEVVSVTATAAQILSGKSTSYRWYLNGMPQAESTSTITFPAQTIPGGDYRLDVVLETQGVLASNHVLFTMAGS